MRLRHTSPWLRRVSLLFRYFSLISFSLFLGACLGGNEIPGGALPGDPSGLPGNYGAPPVSIPGPVALNMSAVTIVAPDSAGEASVTLDAGAGTAGNIVQVKNLGDVALFSPLRRWLLPAAYASGESLSAEIGADGSVLGSLKLPSAPGDWLEFRQCLKSDTQVCSLAYRVEVPASGSVKGTSGVISSPSGGKSMMKMTVDPKGNVILFEESDAGAGRWDWKKLFLSTAQAQENEGADFSATQLNCPLKDGPATLALETNEESLARASAVAGSCKITREIKGKAHRLVIPHCRSPKDLQAYTYGSDQAVWLAAAAGDTVYFFKEKNPSEETEIVWVKSLRFSSPVYKLTASLQSSAPSILVALKGDPSLVAVSPDLSEASCFSSSARELSDFEEMTAFARDPVEAAFYIAARGEIGSSILKASALDGKIMSGGRIVSLKSGLLSEKILSLLYLGKATRTIAVEGENLNLAFERFAYLDGGNQVVFLELPGAATRQILSRMGLDPAQYESLFAWEIPEAKNLSVMEGNDDNAFAVMEEGGNRLFLFRYWNDPAGNLQVTQSRAQEWGEATGVFPAIAYDSEGDQFVVRRRDGQIERMRAMPK